MYFHYYEKMIVEELFALNPVHIDQFQFHYHDDNFFENVLNGLKAKKREMKKFYFLMFLVKKIMLVTWSDVGKVFCAELFFRGRFLLFGELFGYLDVNKLAIISDSFSSNSWHQYLKKRKKKYFITFSFSSWFKYCSGSVKFCHNFYFFLNPDFNYFLIQSTEF